ncbi:MAG: hypothetical protein AUH86_05405 [Acidobacteria bacterium 13_1_40CM_4_58_4]|nr:MAG: hypothetical protein AUH86_05405 [Acidobacteria bacterium 13_1_40CM_4_58_4]
MIESHHGQALSRMGGDGSEQVVEKPYALGEIGRSKDPSAAQATQTINLGKTAGDDERIFVFRNDGLAHREGKWSSLAQEHFEVDLVDQDVRADAMSQLADGEKRFCSDERAAGIVQIGKHNEPRGGRDGTLQFFEVDGESGFESARKALHDRAEIFRDIEKRTVGGLLEENFVAGLENGSHGEMVGHGGASGGDDAFFRDTCMLREALLQRGVAVSARSGDFEFVEAERELG